MLAYVSALAAELNEASVEDPMLAPELPAAWLHTQLLDAQVRGLRTPLADVEAPNGRLLSPPPSPSIPPFPFPPAPPAPPPSPAPPPPSAPSPSAAAACVGSSSLSLSSVT